MAAIPLQPFEMFHLQQSIIILEIGAFINYGVTPTIKSVNWMHVSMHGDVPGDVTMINKTRKMETGNSSSFQLVTGNW